MLNGVMLIVVTTFAVVGAYFLCDLLGQGLSRRKTAAGAVVVWAPMGAESAWGAVMDLRGWLPDAHIVVLTRQAEALQELEPGMKDVVFATPETLAQTVCKQLHIPLDG